MKAFRVAWLTGLLLLTVGTAAPSAVSQNEAPGIGWEWSGVGQERPVVVLVHGAWGGGWDWRPVDRMLTDRGYDVYRVTLTGLGERVHLAADVNLSTHIADVVNTILFEDLRDVVLLGHSYGGMVITGVADSIPDRLETLVYLDAFVPRSGETVADIAPTLAAEGDVLVPSWVDPADPYPRDVPHPAGTLREPLELDAPPGAGVRAAYILTREPGQERDGFEWAADRAAALGWPVYEMEADHNPQRSAREELVRLIQEISGRPPLEPSDRSPHTSS